MKKDKVEDGSQEQESKLKMTEKESDETCGETASERQTPREPSEGTDTTEEKILNNGKMGTNDLSKNEEDELCEQISSLDIDGALSKRGPNGGKPVYHPCPRIASKPYPGSVPYSMGYNGCGQDMLGSNMLSGKRRPDDEEQQPYKFVAPIPNTDLIQQGFEGFPMSNNLNNLGYNITTSTYSNSFQPPPMMPMNPRMPQQQGGFPVDTYLGMPTGIPTMPPAQMIVPGNTNKSGGTVTVTSPIKNMAEPEFPSDLDSFIEGLVSEKPQGPETCPGGTQPHVSQMQPFQAQPGSRYSGSQVNMKAPIPSPICNIPSPGSDLGTDYYRASYTQQQDRRRSDPDSGLESADERSPYQEPTLSPNSYMSPSSVDSGVERSPRHDPFSPDNRTSSSSNLSTGSPPKYTPPSPMCPAASPPYRATPSPASTSGYGSPGMPVLNDETMDPNDGTSRYIDENLDSLHLALNVIADDMKETYEERQRKQKQAELKKMGSVDRTTGSLSNIPNVVQIPTTMAAPQLPGKAVTTSAMPTVVMGMPTSVPTTMAVPNPTAATKAPPRPKGKNSAAGAPQLKQVFIVQGPPQPPTSNPVYMLPVGTNPGVTGPLIILPGQQQAPPPQKKEPRKILPKLPTTSGSSTASGSVTTTTNSQSQKGQVTASKVSAVSSNGSCVPSRQPNPQAPVQQSKLLNIARRTVADIPRDRLKRSDEEGDTYLHIAVCRTDRYMVQALLERLHREGLIHLVDQENNKRQTPLYLAAAINQPIMVSMFIRFNANVNNLAQNLSADGQTREVKAAIHTAVAHGSDYLLTLLELLKAPDININIVNNYGQTALHCAIEAHGRPKSHGEGKIDSVPILHALIKAGADASAQDKKSGKTPLMYAIEQKDLTVVETILRSVDPSKVRNVVMTQAFDGSSCLKIAEGLRDSYNVNIWNKLWNNLQSAISVDGARRHQLSQVY